VPAFIIIEVSAVYSHKLLHNVAELAGQQGYQVSGEMYLRSWCLPSIVWMREEEVLGIIADQSTVITVQYGQALLLYVLFHFILRTPCLGFIIHFTDKKCEQWSI
jgi:hypothetical protein